MTLSTALLQDPIALLEVCAALFTFLYAAKLAFTPVGISSEGGEFFLPFDENYQGSGHQGSGRQRSFNGLFNVGELISLPKRSLRNQSNSRKRGM